MQNENELPSESFDFLADFPDYSETPEAIEDMLLTMAEDEEVEAQYQEYLERLDMSEYCDKDFWY